MTERVLALYERLSRRERRLASAAAALTCILVVWLILVPGIRALSDKLDGVAALKQELSSTKRLLARQERELERYGEELAKLDWDVPASRRVLEFSNEVSALAQEAGITFNYTGKVERESVKDSSLAEYYIEVDFRPDMRSLVLFLKALEASPRLYVVRGITIQRALPPDYRPRVSMGVSALVREGDEG